MNNLEKNDLLIRLDERSAHMEETLEKILEQARITNGRLKKAEEDVAGLKEWRAESRGQWKATSIIGAIVAAIVGWVVSMFSK